MKDLEEFDFTNGTTPAYQLFKNIYVSEEQDKDKFNLINESLNFFGNAGGEEEKNPSELIYQQSN